MHKTYRSGILIIFASFVFACSNDSTSDKISTPTGVKSKTETRKPVSIPPFNRDSAYTYVADQVAFGTRQPGSEGIENARKWMINTLKRFGAEVIEQKFDARFYTGETHASVNIIGKINPSHKNRIILAAHYDTRFMAEQDSDEARKNEPILGADDGASGVGVLMEIARLINDNPIDLGIDIVLFDAEDQGQRGNQPGSRKTWCIGSQYWSKTPHIRGYKANFGILLDMVGAKDATFNRENVKGEYRNADQVHDLYRNVWSLARAMGKGNHFLNRTVSWIIDDHYYVNTIAGITMIDIINKPPSDNIPFGLHWHTHNDNMDIIDKGTLGAVGQVVTAVLYRESTGAF
jgi:Zn-dependent M28 family amino/carboxypeptidase